MFMHKTWPRRRAHHVKYENIHNSDLDGMSLASFCQSRGLSIGEMDDELFSNLGTRFCKAVTQEPHIRKFSLNVVQIVFVASRPIGSY